MPARLVIPSSFADGEALVANLAGRTLPALELTRALARGDRLAFEVLYREHFGRMVGLAQRATGRDEAFSLDVVHDAFVRIIDRPVICESDELLRAWLRRVVLAAAIDRLRAEARRRGREAVAGERLDGMESGGAEWAAERLAWLAVELKRLPDQDRELIELRFRAERSLAEIAAGGTGLGWAAVHGRIRRAIERLRRSAEEFFS